MQTTNINWTDKVWNPVTGCTKVSAGCKNCYAETIANRFWKDREFTDVRVHPERLNQPLKIKKPAKIFVNSMSDLFHETIHPQDIIFIFETMKQSIQHTFLVLTKRPAKMKSIMNFYDEQLRNVWLGVSIEDQKTADERIPLLLQTPAGVHWLSIEPLLEDINLDTTQLFDNKMRGRHTIDWVVIGCESGPKKRECKTEWISKIVWQCQQAKIKVWVKQININGKVVEDINQFPKHLQVRELPA